MFLESATCRNIVVVQIYCTPICVAFKKLQEYRNFLTIARFFFRARALVFLAEQDKKNFFSYRNFGYKEFYFLKGKKLAMVKKMVF